MLTMKEIVDLARGDNEYQRLAADLGVHKATVSKWVQGIGVPDPEQIPELARLAGLSVPAVAIAALATRDRKHAKAQYWRKAWDQLDRKDCILCQTEGDRRRSQRSTQLSGWGNNHQPALQTLTNRALSRAWHWLRGYSASSRTVSAAPSLPMLALTAA